MRPSVLLWNQLNVIKCIKLKTIEWVSPFQKAKFKWNYTYIIKNIRCKLDDEIAKMSAFKSLTEFICNTFFCLM